MKMRFCAALLFVVIASLATMPHANAATLWYNGDKSQAGLDNEVVKTVGGEAYGYVYDDFTVTGNAWHVTSVWSNNLMNYTGVTQADWFIRSGVSVGSPGTLIASGTSAAATLSATGRSEMVLGVLRNEYRVEVSGLDITLAPGTYWLSVAPVVPGWDVSFISATAGANAVGTPPGNNANSFMDERYDLGSIYYHFASIYPKLSSSHDFSMGISGTQIQGPTFMISGTATSGSAGLSGVTMSGLPGTPVTQSDGSYSGTVTYGWSGTVTPTLAGYNFTPASKAYDNVQSNQTQDYTASLVQTAQTFPFFDDFSTDKGWFGYEIGRWERAIAFAGGGENGYPDPGTDYSASDDNYILGFGIGADYPNDLTEEKSIISPPIDCTGQDQVFLKLRRYLNVEGNEYDHARIYVSNDGTTWTQVWENPVIDLMDSQWMPFVLDISSVAANQGTVSIKFTMGPTNSSRRFSGWNIDDLEVTSEAVYPSEGTMGTELEITGSNFGAKKGKVLVGSTALKVLEWNNEFIQALLAKPVDSGVYDVTIRPSEPKGALPIIEEDAFVVRPAEIHSIGQSSGSAYDQATIKGKFFGTKKGTVSLEYEEGGSLIRKTCKVNSWTMDPTTGDSEIVFVVPSMLPSVCDVVVDPYGSIPETEEKDGFTVKAPEIASIAPSSGSVGEQITIPGNYFGLKPGKVYLGYLSKGKPTKKSCSIISWGDDVIVFVVPKLSLGTYDVIVTNSVGSDTLAGVLQIK
jgi:hypothetical protein